VLPRILSSVLAIRVIVIGFLRLAAFVLAAEASDVAPGVTIEEVPEWVDAIIDFTPQASPPYAEGGVYYHRSSDHFRPGEDAVFSRLVLEFQSHAGLEENSTLTWNVDPGFERVGIHWIRVFREGKWIDLMPDAEIDVVDARTEVQSWFYDDSKDVRIILKRIQVGDVLDYGFTRWGSNPVVDEFYSSSASLGYAVPVKEISVRIDWPDDLEGFRFRTFPEPMDPMVSHGDGMRIMEWRIEDSQPVVTDYDLPPDEEVLPWVQFSNWPDWRSVANWAVDLYPLSTESLPPMIDEVARDIRSMENDPFRRATEALQFVQDSIRYVSIPVGPHSYQPYPVSEIIDRRYGDCKDKSLLLVLLLREMEIPAELVLVDTEEGRLLDHRLPTPSAFDHVVVRAVIDDVSIWMDPTDSHQGGVLPNRYFGDFGFGLVVSPETSALINDVGPQASREAKSSATEVFTFSAYDAPVKLMVRSDFHGRDADRIRHDLAMDGVDSLERAYANYYASLYNVIPKSSTIEVEDERQTNHLRIKERYQLPPLFRQKQGETTSVVSFSAGIIRDLLPRPSERIRSGPFALPSPLRQSQTIVLHLPNESAFDAESFELENEWIQYQYSVEQEGQRLRIEHHFESLGGAVPTDQLEDYLGGINEIDRHLDYSIEIDWDYARDGPADQGLFTEFLSAFGDANLEVPSAKQPSESVGSQPGERLVKMSDDLSLAEGLLIGIGMFLGGVIFAAIVIRRV